MLSGPWEDLSGSFISANNSLLTQTISYIEHLIKIKLHIASITQHPLRPQSSIQGVRERARVPQLVMLCRRWAHLQCFAGRTGRTHGTTAGYCVAGKRAQHRNIRHLKKI